jgi:peptidyl-prolyl cis-trans isomerase D
MALMNRMRENTKTILMILVFAFILTIIIDWGMGGFKQNQPRGIIAVVDGHEISYEEFYNRYQQELTAYREQSGTEAEGYQLQQIENKAYENLIQQQLLADVAAKIHLQPTDAAIVEELYNNPPDILRSGDAFKDSSGAFDIQKYKSALENPSANWGPVEDYVRLIMPMQELESLISTSVIVTDDDARLQYMKNNQKATVHYLFYNAADYSRFVTEPEEKEIQAYYDQHSKEEFHEPEKRQIDYVLLEVKTTKADSEAVFKQAEEIIEEAKSGGNFAELAELYSKDPGSAKNGGDLGFFKKGSMVKPFEDAAFSAKQGDIVGPVQTQFGLHIIKVMDKKQEKGELEVKASHILLKFEASQSTRETLRDEANYIAEAAKESGLESIVKAEGFSLQKSQPFTTDGMIPGIGMERRVSRSVFRGKKGTVSDVYTLEKGYLVFSTAEIILEHIKPIAEVRAQIINTLKSQKRLELAKNRCKTAYDKIIAGTSFESAAAQDSLTIQNAEGISMSGYVANVGREPRFVGAALGLEIGQFSQPVEGSRGYYLIQLVDKTSFSDDDFAKQKESLKRQVLQNRQQAIYNLWYKTLRDGTEIKDYRNNYL